MAAKEQLSSGADEYQHVVVLVHGTSACGADWTHPDSPLAKTVASALGGHVLVRPFNWSGRNSHEERLSWSTVLAKRLVSLGRFHPQSLLHIVAHSHGGNVVAYALRSPEIRDLVNSVVCLGTPFIIAHPRNLTPTFRLLSFMSIMSSIAVLLLAAIWVLTFGWGMFKLPTVALDVAYPDSIVFMASMFILLLVGGGLLFLAWRLLSRLSRYVRTKAEPRLMAMQKQTVIRLQEQFGAVPVLNVQARGDEARGYLGVIDIMAGLPFQLWRPAFLFWISVSLTAIVAAIIAVGLYNGLLKPETFALPQEAVPSFRDVITGFLAVGFFFAGGLVVGLLAITVILQLICAGWPKIFRGHALGFGEDGFMKNLLVAISAATNPPNAQQLKIERLDVKGWGLRHSALYQDERVLRAIADWMGALVKRREEAHEPITQRTL